MNHSKNQIFKKIGLTKQETKIYQLLLEKGKLTAKQVSRKLSIFPHAVYRTAGELVNKGLIGKISHSPITYHALPPNTGVTSYINSQIDQLETIKQKLTNHLKGQKNNLDPGQIHVIYGKNEIYDLGASLLNNAKHEMLVISVGEEITPDLLKAVNSAKKRKVLIRLIAQQYDEHNKEILNNFVKNGYQVRHFPASGYHLAIYDAEISLIIISDSHNNSQRTAVFFNNKGLSVAFRQYFSGLWQKAKKI